jgi:hypothetical protein
MAKGLYTAEQAAAAEAAGISVASGGMSTLTKVGIGVLAVGAAGGAIAAADSGSSSSHSSSAAEELTPQTILGTWNLSGQNTVGSTATGTFTFNSNGRFTADTTEKIGDNDAADYYYEGDWSLDGTELTLAYDLGAEYIGQASGDSKNFSMTATNQSYPWTLNFSR